VTYPNVMVLDYMKQVGQISPELQMQAEEFVAQGYQRLLSFEVPGGGFSLFGKPPADPLLSAYGLMMLSDMGRVYPVDKGPVERTARWLLEQQQSDGSWAARGWREAAALNTMEDRLPATAFVVWALAKAGYGQDGGAQRGLAYLREHLAAAEDPYVLALCANALSSLDPHGGGTAWVLDRLAEQALVEGEAVYWQAGMRTFMGGGGQVGSIEVTALAAQALLRAARHPDLAQGALTYLIQQKDSDGTWQTTQATVWALQALLLSAIQGADTSAEVTVTVSVNGGEAEPIVLDEHNAGVVHVLAFDDVGSGENRVAFRVAGNGRPMVQVTTEYYLPWEQVPAEPVEQEPLTVEVSYDRTTLAVQDEVTVRVWLNLNAPGTAQMVLLDLGLPPGFAVLDEDLQALVAQGLIERFELAGRQIIVYLTDLPSGQPLSFRYRLQAKYPLRVQVPSSQAYDYYSPDRRGEERPLQVVVMEEEIKE
jgi:uncharacterized protein YfaS (alpha-2-macroglobulin family)